MKSFNDYVDRLYSEWLTHGKIIIGVDFDDTISPWKFTKQENCNEVIELLQLAQATGAYLVIHTACNSDRYAEILTYCQSHGLNINTINENPIDLPYGKSPKSKPMCNIYLDDRAGLNEALAILEMAMYKKRAQKAIDSQTDQTML